MRKITKEEPELLSMEVERGAYVVLCETWKGADSIRLFFKTPVEDGGGALDGILFFHNTQQED